MILLKICSCGFPSLVLKALYRSHNMPLIKCSVPNSWWSIWWSLVECTLFNFFHLFLDDIVMVKGFMVLNKTPIEEHTQLIETNVIGNPWLEMICWESNISIAFWSDWKWFVGFCVLIKLFLFIPKILVICMSYSYFMIKVSHQAYIAWMICLHFLFDNKKKVSQFPSCFLICY